MPGPCIAFFWGSLAFSTWGLAREPAQRRDLPGLRSVFWRCLRRLGATTSASSALGRRRLITVLFITGPST